MSLSLPGPSVDVVVLLVRCAEQHLVQDLGILIVVGVGDARYNLVKPPEGVALDKGNLEGKFIVFNLRKESL